MHASLEVFKARSQNQKDLDFDTCLHEAEAYMRLSISKISTRNDIPDSARQEIAEISNRIGALGRYGRESV